MPQFLPLLTRPDTRVMVFVDGENLAIRYKAELGDKAPCNHIAYVPDVMVWSPYASRSKGPEEYVRRYFYTSTTGDAGVRAQIESKLREAGIEAPRVFSRDKNGRSKQVDITLTTEMLTHAHRDNFDVAVLVSGDGDYVSLVEAVKAEGKRVALWALGSGLSPKLRMASDHYWDIGELLFREGSNQAFLSIYD